MTGSDLALHRDAFDDLVARAAEELVRGHLEHAAVAAQVAATYAWFNHPGLFASRALEEVVAEVGRQLPDRAAGSSSTRDDGPAPDVLHLATEVYGTGGHTRMLTNWIASDTGAVHHVCLTGQRGRPVPDSLVQALSGRGRVTELDATEDHLLGRASALRSLALGATTVVLHVHPHDVVPALALAARPRRTRVVAVDHADHVFWVGTTTPDVVVHLRGSGAELGAARRGIAPDRSALLPRPLATPPRRHTPAQARDLLGVPHDRTLLVTAAAGSKYDRVDGVGLLDVVGPWLRRRSGVFLLAAGPAPQGEWAALEAAGLGRALGLVTDVRPVLEAADVYLDSYPFSSLTSMLEAAALGVPVVTLRHPPPDRSARPGAPDVLGADTPELDDVLVVATSPEEHGRLLDRLVADPEARRVLGERTRRAVAEVHGGGAWVRAAHAVLDGPPAGAAPAPCPADDVWCDGPLDRRVAQVQQRTGWGHGRRGALVLNAPVLPLRRRVRLVVALTVAGRRPSPRLLLSAAGARRLRTLRARARRASRP